VVLTNADIDHIAGLLTLREKTPFTVYATSSGMDILIANSVFNVLDAKLVARRTIVLEETFEPVPGVEVTAFSVPGKVALFLEDEMFDLVVALDVIEHITDDGAALSEYYRITKHNGILLLTVPAYSFLWGAHDEINDHKRRYVADELKNKVEKTGFTVGKLTYFNTFLFPFVLLARMGQRLMRMVNGRHKPRSDLKLYPFIINDLLEAIFMLEEGLLRKYDLPYGVSLLCVAKKA